MKEPKDTLQGLTDELLNMVGKDRGNEILSDMRKIRDEAADLVAKIDITDELQDELWKKLGKLFERQYMAGMKAARVFHEASENMPHLSEREKTRKRVRELLPTLSPDDRRTCILADYAMECITQGLVGKQTDTEKLGKQMALDILKIKLSI